MKYKAFLLLLLFAGCTSTHTNHSWRITAPIFEQGSQGSFDEVAVKDPSLVFYQDAWHLFYSARGNGEYTTGYVSAKDLGNLQEAERFELPQIRGKTRYGCAPQVFYFEPQQTWYLLYQNRDANYEAVFSTNVDIANPAGWTPYQKLIDKDSPQKWIDFWCIADKEKMYLFYTEAHQGVMVRSTTLEDFPRGWGRSQLAFDNVHEAVHVYKVKGKGEYHMIYELNTDGVRSFGLAKAIHLEGPWEKVTDEYASGDQLRYAANTEIWTEMVSHGEAIRSGYDQRMEYDPEGCQWVIQGILLEELGGDYPSLPWRLGVMELVGE